jgi:hypothetical protein
MNTVCFVGIAAMAAISFGAKPAGIGYLPAIGPAPLRFQSPCKGMEMTVMLPPLVMSDPASATNQVTMTTNETEIVEAPAQPTTPLVVAAQPPVVVEPAFTPQMLLQFFRSSNGTNQTPGFLMPFQFIPPATPVIPAPPSTATYTKQ